MRKRFILAHGSLAVLAALAGCGGGGGGGSAAVTSNSGTEAPASRAINSAAATGSNATDSGTTGTGTTGSATTGGTTGSGTTGSGTTGSGTTGSGTTGSGTTDTAAGVPPPSGSSSALPIGVNIHTGGRSTTANDQIASIMASRNFTQARLDYFVDSDITLLRDQIAKINANGGRTQLVVQNSYQWDFSCNQNLSAVEQDSYTQARRMVVAMKDLVQDYEILNEIQLRPDLRGQVAWNAQGTSTAAYDNSSCAHTLAAVARGMSRAIHEQGQRTILGAVGRDWGFLTFMAKQGVTWDVTGYHVYPRYGDASLLSDPWYGNKGPLYQLSLFGKPITVNEFNCGEIYDSGYENQAGMSLTETCLKSLNKHLADLRRYSGSVPLESVHVYELLDEPNKAAPENRFGLMYTLTSPKPAQYLVAAYAGGSLTTAEAQAITSRGLLTDAQIAAMK